MAYCLIGPDRRRLRWRAVLGGHLGLSTIADGTVIVVRAFKTRKELAQYCLRTLHDVSARVTGIVLNAVNLDRDEYRYSYQYYRRDTYCADPTALRTTASSPKSPESRPSADA